MDLKELLSNGEDALLAAIKNKEQESLSLEFKLAKEGKEPIFKAGKLTDKGKRVVAEALSAFSNSAGGLLVLGVKCTRNSDGIDCASELSAIDNYESVQSYLSSTVGGFIAPVNELINVYGFPSSDGPNKGYIVIEVPRSERRPHRSEAKDQKGYYKRSGSSTKEMEHYDIEDAFRRLIAPELKVELRFSPGGQSFIDPLRYTVKMEFWLQNVGEAIAEYPILTVTRPSKITLNGGYGADVYQRGVRMEPVDNRLKYYADQDFVLIPQDERYFAHLQFDVFLNDQGQVISMFDGSNPTLDFEIKFTLSAKNMRTRSGIIVLDRIELKSQPWHANAPIAEQLEKP